MAGGFLGGGGGLMADEGIARVILANEVVAGDFAAEVAVDAGGVDEVASGDVFGDFLIEVSHRPVRDRQ